MNKKIEDALNAQINAELFSAYLYLSMAAYFDSLNLTGFSNWMKVQQQEEQFHAQKIFDYINERGGRVILDALDKPATEWKSALHVFEESFKHEQYITKRINDLVELSRNENDHATYNFLQWYVSEQVEEEASVDDVVQKLKLVGDFGPGIFMVDQELAQRTFTPPADEEA